MQNIYFSDNFFIDVKGEMEIVDFFVIAVIAEYHCHFSCEASPLQLSSSTSLAVCNSGRL
jgi:hypothetical protein